MNTNERQVFHVDVVADDEPMTDDAFYIWLNEQEGMCNSFTQALGSYLHTLGWNKDKYKLNDYDLDTLRYIYSYYVDMWVPSKKTFTFSELFTQESDRGFYLMGMSERVMPTDELFKLMKYFTLVYSFSPRDYYFEIINGYLFVKYQYILGSRRVCKVYADDRSIRI